jgi:membrane protein implicated in regulation of membrane protease activity
MNLVFAGFLCALGIGTLSLLSARPVLRDLAAHCAVLLLTVAPFTGAWPLVTVSIGVLALTLFRLRARPGRRSTRATSDMDHEVHERIREISAESRYSSAGIEF